MTHFKPVDLAWLAVVTLLRTASVTFSAPREVGMELLIMLIAWGIGAGVELLVKRYFPQQITIDTTGSLVPLALTASALVLTTVLDYRSLFPVGVLLLSVPLWFPEDHTNTILTNTLATAVLITRTLHEYQAEYLFCAGFYFILVCIRTDSDGHTAVRSLAAVLILGAYSLLKMYHEGVPIFRFHDDPFCLSLQALGYALLFFRAPNSVYKPALRLLALTLPGGNGFIFWSLVAFGEEHCKKASQSEKEMYQKEDL